MNARDVHALFGDKPCHNGVDGNGRQSHSRKKQALVDHQHKIKDHHSRVYCHGRKGVDERVRHGRVHARPRLNVASEPLREELHGQVNNLPHVRGVADYPHLAINAERVNRLDPCGDQLKNRKHSQHRRKRPKPVGIDARQQAVQENPRRNRVYDAKEIGKYGRYYHKSSGGARTHEPLFRELEHTLAAAARNVVLRRRGNQDDARKRLVELLPGNLYRTAGRIVEVHVLPTKAVEHDEVLHVPVDYAGERSVVPEVFGRRFVGLHIEAVALRRRPNVAGLGPVARHAAVQARLLDRHPRAVVRHHHRKRRGAALERLELHNDGDLSHTLCARRVYFGTSFT